MFLAEISNSTILLYLAGFLRIGTCFMYMPAISDVTVSPLIRLILAVIATIAVTPYISMNIPIINEINGYYLLLFVQELIIGLAIMCMSRIFLSAIHVAGMTIGSMLGLSISMLFDPAQQSQTNTIGSFFSLVITMLILTNNIHLLFIKSIVESYNIIHFADMTNYNSLMEGIIQNISKMWLIGIQMSGPFILVNVILMFGSGVLSKLMPQLQIFFVMVPAQILLGVIVLLVSISGICTWFVEQYSFWLHTIMN